jgi:hypothetical protein
VSFADRFLNVIERCLCLSVVERCWVVFNIHERCWVSVECCWEIDSSVLLREDACAWVLLLSVC